MANQYNQVSFIEGLMMADPESLPVHLGDQRAPRLIAYDAKNVIPTSAGYSSYFGTDIKLGSGVIPVQVQTVLCYRTKAGDTLLLALCSDGAYMRSVRGDGVIGVVDTTDIVITLAAGGLGSWTKVFSPVAEAGNPWQLWTYTILDNALYVYVKGMAFIARLESTVANEVTVTKVVPTILNTANGKVNTATIRVQQEADNSTYKAITLNSQEFRIEIAGGLAAVESTVDRLVDVAGAHEDFTVKPIAGTRTYDETDLIASYELDFLGVRDDDLIFTASHSGQVGELTFTLDYVASYFMIYMGSGIYQASTGLGDWSYEAKAELGNIFMIAQRNNAWTDGSTWLFLASAPAPDQNYGVVIYYSTDEGVTLTRATIHESVDDYFGNPVDNFIIGDDIPQGSHFVKTPNGDIRMFIVDGVWLSIDEGLTWDFTAYVTAPTSGALVAQSVLYYSSVFWSRNSYSTDGINWINPTVFGAGKANVVAFLDKMYSVSATKQIMQSDDFDTITAVHTITDTGTNASFGIAVLNGMMYVTNSEGKIWRSATGESGDWDLVADLELEALFANNDSRFTRGLSYQNGHYVAAWEGDTGVEGQIATSHSLDGLTWSAAETYTITATMGDLSTNWEY